MNEGSRTLLNEHQHRALSSRLALLDRQLSEAERLVTSELARGPMFAMSSDLTAREKQDLQRLLAQAREIVAKLRDRFALEVQTQDVRHWLLGHFSVLWNILHDSRAEKLKGFGDVAGDLSTQLDPEIEQLIEIVSEVKSLVSSSHQPAGG